MAQPQIFGEKVRTPFSSRFSSTPDFSRVRISGKREAQASADSTVNH
jgi:rRNA maturation protein Nop10